MDLSLAVLIVLAAGFAGAAVAVPRGWRAGVVTAGAVLGWFALMLGLARVWLPGTFLVAAGGGGAAAYLTLVADLGRTRAVRAASAAGVIVGVSALFVSYLAVMALIGAAGVYVVLRRWLRARSALLVMGGTLGTLLAGSAAVFAIALSGM